MKPIAPTTDPSFEDEVFGLWEGGFDTATIAEVLTMEWSGPPVTEAEVYNLIARRSSLPPGTIKAPKPHQDRRAVSV